MQAAIDDIDATLAAGFADIMQKSGGGGVRRRIVGLQVAIDAQEVTLISGGEQPELRFHCVIEEWTNIWW